MAVIVLRVFPKGLLISVAVVGTFAVNCKKQEAMVVRPEFVSGLQSVPESSEVLIGFDFAKLRESDVIKKTIAKALLFDSATEDKLKTLRELCGKAVLDATNRGYLAMEHKTGASVLVLEGGLQEADTTACLSAFSKKYGGKLESFLYSLKEDAAKNTGTQVVKKRRGYKLQTGSKVLWLSFGGPQTLIVSSSDTWLEAATSTKDTILNDVDFSKRIAKVSKDTSFWGVGAVTEKAGKRISQLASTSNGPEQIEFSMSIGETWGFFLGLEFASKKDAAKVVSQAKEQLDTAVQVAQKWRLGKALRELVVKNEGSSLQCSLSLKDSEVFRGLLAMLSAPPLTSKVEPKVNENGTKNTGD